MYIDLLIKIKNAMAAKQKSFKTSFNKMDKAMLEILKKHKFISEFEVKGRSPKKYLEVEVAGGRLINGLKILSKPSRRLYAPYKDFRRVKNGFGALIVSTPKGIMDARTARKEKVGGQLLFEIW